jgi:hypothetical protein
MKRMFTNSVRALFQRAVLVPVIAAGFVAYSENSYAQNQSIEQTDADLTPCGTYNAAALDHRPIPASLGGQGLLDAISKNGF